MVSLPELKEYVAGYKDRKPLMEIALCFSKIGEMTMDIDPSLAGLYSGTQQFICDTVIQAFRSKAARFIDIELSEALIPLPDPSCDECLHGLGCEVTISTKDHFPIYRELRIFSISEEFDQDHYMGFTKMTAEKAAAATATGIKLEEFVLRSFVRYAYQMGCGMPVDEAVNSRRAEVQIRYSMLQ